MLVSGSSLYNELIRSCLPAVYPQAPDSDLEVGQALLVNGCSCCIGSMKEIMCALVSSGPPPAVLDILQAG